MMEDRPNHRLLILGGTGEAAAIAAGAVQRFGDRLTVTTSLAGRTEHPAALPGAVRIGGFGGAQGLAAYIAAQAIDVVIDATHPFAARISRHARLACEETRTPRLQVIRPMWQRHALDRWIEVDDLAGAARATRLIGRRAFLTVGAGEIGAFSEIDDVRFLVRLVDAPRAPLPLKFHEIVLGRGPFAVAEEHHLLVRHAIDVVVSKASGGSATEAKILAARACDLPVVMVRRPLPEPGEHAADPAGALDWLALRMAGSPAFRVGDVVS